MNSSLKCDTLDTCYASIFAESEDNLESQCYSDEEDDNENQEVLFVENKVAESNLQTKEVEEILKHLALDINSSNITKFNIARSSLWEGVKRGLSRKSFSPYNKVSVKFTDDFGNSEGVVDLGGPMREMFTLAIQWMVESHLFCGNEHNKFVSFQAKCLEESEYYFAGVVTAMSLVHGGPGLQELAPKMYEALVRELYEVVIKVEDVYDPELRKLLQMLLDASSKEEAMQLMNEDSNLTTTLDLAGTLHPIHSVDDVKGIVRTTARWFVLGRAQPAIEQFKKGLSALHVLQSVKANFDAFRSVFCYSDEVLDSERMESLFTARLSPVGSSKALTESLVISRWRDYLIDVEEGEEPMQMCDILYFVTGCKCLPPRSIHPCIEFLHEPEENGQLSRFPKANTCANTLCLPVVHGTYDAFKADMTFGIHNGRGFGIA